MEFKKNRPVYLQIADHLAEQILQKQLSGGDKIPSIRDWAKELNVSPNTIQRSYDSLRERGIIQKTSIGHIIVKDARALVVSWRKKRLMENELPVFFKTMYMLKIEWEEIENEYERFTIDFTMMR